MNDNLKKETILVNNKEINVFFDYDINECYISQKELARVFDTSVDNIGLLIRQTNEDSSVVPIIIETEKLEGKKYVKRKIKHYTLSNIKEICYKLNYNLTNELFNMINDMLNSNNSLNKANNYDIVRFDNGEIQIDVNVSTNAETVWLNQKDLSILFDTTIPNISMHIHNILNSGELNKDSVIKEFLTTGTDNKKYSVTYYNLDLIISVGFRINSKRGIEFRKWALKVLKDYLIKGYSINDKRCLECHDSLINLNNRVSKLESNNALLNDTIFGKQYMKMIEGDVSESIRILERIFCLAKNKIIIVDNYIDEYIIRIVEKYNVNIIIITGNSKIKDLNLKDNITVIVDGSYHSRYILIDDKHTYISTHSLNMISKKDFEIIYLAEVNPKYILNRFNK